MISKTQYVYPVLLLMFSCHILKYTNAVTDTILQGQHLNHSETIVSSNQTFELGFFAPSNSTNYYVGIWYKNISEQTVVWLANRDFPLTDSPILSISSDGNLVIRQGKITYRVTDVASSANVSATLLDSGNLVMRDAKSNILWESFDFPSDTFLPGMKLGYDKGHRKNWSYVSWKSANDPSPGNFILELDPRRENRISILNGVEISWNSSRHREADPNVFDFPQETRMNMYSFNFVSEFDMAYLNYNHNRKDDISRLRIDATGQLQQFVWLDNQWNLFNSQPSQPCDVYAYCGANASCTSVSSPTCRCLPGFDPSEAWKNGSYGDGCFRKNALQCGSNTKAAGDGFLKLSKVIVPKKPLPLEVQSIDECRSSCLNNCNCTGYSYINRSCSIWIGDLINLQQLSANDTSGTDFFLKLSAADLESRKRPRSKRKQTIIITVTVSVTILTLALLIWQVKMKKDKRKGEDLLSFEVSTSPAPTKTEQSQVKQQQKHKKEVEIPVFSFSSVAAATNNFSLSNKLGEGGFGPVYKGKLLKGNEVAVKRLSRKSGQGWDELKNEAMLIAKLQHKNLVKLLGCCIEGDEKILVYEYLPNKSLDFFLFGKKNIFTLAWGTRVRIIEGIAQGLLYLHQFSRLQIIHRDLKASNILLDEDMNPKISDFGMARIFGGSEPRATDRIVGTYGYMAPEYALEGVFSVKSDVFSFGVLLLEILSGKKNTGFYQSNSLNLLGYAWDLWTSNRPLELLESGMQDSSSANAAIRYINIALLCVQERAADRPTMSDVVLMVSNELTSLPSPTLPAFSNVRSMVDVIRNSSQNKPEIYSENKLTISVLDAR